ncbi:MAG: PQQ-binding-like beta-propeller repeat protein [Acidobacteriia bacterium]|nr:PQQ-binding-like beta-propeller repeat protein [Terriglobia bacterium]
MPRHIAPGLLFAATVLLSAADWPQFRGPNGSGVAPADAAPPVEFKNPVWKQPLPAGHSSPAVWGDRIFLNSFDTATKKLELICLSTRDGKILWRRTAPAPEIEETHNVSNPATATPAVDADRVYAYFSSYGVMTFDHAGEPQWMLPLTMPKTHHGSGASPILAGDLLILNHDAMQGGYLLAVDRRSGKQIWKQTYPLERGRVESYSTPLVWHDQLILHRAGVVESYTVATGERRWSLPENTSGASSPAASDDLLFVGTWNVLGEEDQRAPLPAFSELLQRYDKNADGTISESEFPEETIRFTARPELEAIARSQNFVAFKNVDRNKDGQLDAAEWDAYRTRIQGMAQDHGLLAIRPGGEKPAVVWRENTAVPEVPSPLLYSGKLFLVRNGGILTCLDPISGKVIYRTRARAPGAYYASPIGAAGRVYLASSEGVVTVLAAASDHLDILARNELEEDIVATPAIVGKRIYIRTLHTLQAFE